MEQKKKRMSNKTFSAIVFPLLAVLAVVVIVANVMLNQYASIISIFLNQATFETVDETPANLRGQLDPDGGLHHREADLPLHRGRMVSDLHPQLL